MPCLEAELETQFGNETVRRQVSEAALIHVKVGCADSCVDSCSGPKKPKAWD
jgi:hypothetical protein